MSIATKCICGHSISGYCLERVKKCMLIHRSGFDAFCLKHDCTEEEKKKLRAFLFAFRHGDIDLDMLERIIKKYDHLL
jgi:hypothetical protein